MFIFYSNFGLPPNNDTKNFIFGLQESAKATMYLLRFCFLRMSLRVKLTKSYIVIHKKNAFELYL